jgi:hypothetical protein
MPAGTEKEISVVGGLMRGSKRTVKGDDGDFRVRGSAGEDGSVLEGSPGDRID